MEYNFILVDDDLFFRNSIEKIIKNKFKNKEYEIYSYNDYNKDFYEITNMLIKNKVYILDIEVPTKDGISIAREIRKHDIESIIIFVSGYEKDYSRTIWKSTLEIFCFINKHDNFENVFKARLEDIIDRLNIAKYITFTENNCTYKVFEDSMFFIESFERGILIYTKNTTISSSKILTELEDMLSDHFIRTHRACIVNAKNIVEYNNNKIIFLDNIQTDLITRKYKENLDKYFKK